MNLKERAIQLQKDIPAVFLALNKRGTPWYAKILAILTIGYALSPIDIIPDFIPVIGYLDDVIILPLMIAATIKLIPKEIIEQCRIESEQLWKDGKPKSWYYALPILLIWVIIVALLIKNSCNLIISVQILTSFNELTNYGILTENKRFKYRWGYFSKLGR
ncbi:MAG: hypothetical protein K0R07_83 [Sedimentibacter sp.]|nr:hypothetical protein [Sedimentibacter sp.]